MVAFRNSANVPTKQYSVIKFLPHTLHMCSRNLITGLTSAASPRVDISSTCKVGQKRGVSLPLLTFSPSAWPSRLLYRRGRKSRRDLWITLYNAKCVIAANSKLVYYKSYCTIQIIYCLGEIKTHEVFHRNSFCFTSSALDENWSKHIISYRADYQQGTANNPVRGVPKNCVTFQHLNLEETARPGEK